MTKPPLFSREHFSVNENSLLPLKNLPQSSQNKQGFVCTKGFPAKKSAWAIRILGLACLICHGSAADCTTSDEGDSSTPAWRYVVNFGLIIVLIVLSGLFSGLTLGLLGLDKIGLQIVIDGGNKDLAKHAKKIQPLRENGNLLLCTLLLGNVAVNALLSILMADLTSGLVGFFLSTIFIVIFGEIIPQASCSRYAPPTKTPEESTPGGGQNEGNSAANTELGNRMRNIGFISLTARTTGTAWLGAFRNGPATAMLVGQALDAVSARYNCQVIGHTFRATWLDSHVSNPPQDAVVLTRTEDGENQDEGRKDNEEQT